MRWLLRLLHRREFLSLLAFGLFMPRKSKLQSITVTPSTPSMWVGDSIAFTATGRYTNRSVENLTSRVTWASSAPSILPITNTGIATALTAGSARISATLGAVEGFADVAGIRFRNVNADPAGSADGPDDITCASCSQAHVQAAVDAAVDGNIIGIPAGTCTWTGGVTIANKDIYIRGAGLGSTIINGHASSSPSILFFYSISNAAKGGWRLGHMTMGGTVTNAAVKASTVGAIIPSGIFRIHHIHFNYPAAFNRHFSGGTGIQYGLMDHNTHDSVGGFITNQQWQTDGETLFGNVSSAIATQFGTNKFLVVEDSTMTMHNPASTGFIYDSSAGGGRATFRYNAFVGPLEIYNHWTRESEVCAQVLEVYNNTWTIRPGDNNPGDGLMRMESGTGVFYNNTCTGFTGSPYIYLDDRRSNGESAGFFGACDGSKAWDGNAGDVAAPGWPCLGQIGRGWTANTSLDNLVAGTVEQPSEPFYMWNNGTDAGCATGGACTDSIAAFVEPAAYIKKTAHAVNGEVDYVENGSTPKPGYTAYTYPHPVQATVWP